MMDDNHQLLCASPAWSGVRGPFTALPHLSNSNSHDGSPVMTGVRGDKRCVRADLDSQLVNVRAFYLTATSTDLQ